MATSVYGANQDTPYGVEAADQQKKLKLATPTPEVLKTSTVPNVGTPGGPSAMIEPPNPTTSVEGGDLLHTTLMGPTTDRFKLAGDQFDTFAKSTDPIYQKSLKDATGAAAATGRLGSGQLRTSYGDLAANRALQLDTERSSLLQQAINDSISDEYKNVAIAQQQQGFQAGQQQNAAQLQLAKDQLAEQARQFGLNQEQQLKLAQLSDATANRQIDLATAQGQNQLLAQLAAIVGGDLGSVPPQLLTALLNAAGATGSVSAASINPQRSQDLAKAKELRTQAASAQGPIKQSLLDAASQLEAKWASAS